MNKADEIVAVLKGENFGNRANKIKASRRLRLHRLVLEHGYDDG